MFEQFDAAAFAARFPTIEVTYADGLAPFQAEGFIEGWPFYLRSRGGTTRLDIFEHGGSASKSEARWMASEEVALSSLVREKDFALFERLLAALAPAPFLYHFLAASYELSGEPLTVTLTGKQHRQASWGHSAEEAREELLLPSWIPAHYTIEEDQRDILRTRWIAAEPVQEDPRIFAETPPFITVKNEG